MRTPCGILLAAGAGRRFGSNKLLHPLADGTPLILHSLRLLMETLPQTFVVVDSKNDSFIEVLSGEAVVLVPNPDASRGMGSSLACGVEAASSADGWVIALADMPWIQPQTIQAVAGSLDDERTICAASYQGKRGHPVGFGRSYAKALMGLDGDEGARSVVLANRMYLKLINTNDPGVIADIDYPHELKLDHGVQIRRSPV